MMNQSSRDIVNTRFHGNDDILETIASGRSRVDNKARLPTFTIRT